MDSKHITRDFSAHKKSIVRPYDEFVKLEIFSFDPKFTKTYLAEDNTLKEGSNCAKTSWKSWSCYKSKDTINDMVFNIKYNVAENGYYRMDYIYEQSNHIHDNKNNTGKDLVGNVKMVNNDSTIWDSSRKFDGENNVIKRIEHFRNLDKGTLELTLEVPHNCYFLGVIIRKVVKYVGDNYYGDALGSEEGNLMLLSSTLSLSDMTKPSELTCEIGYDDAFECDESPSGFYMDYHDEVNFYVKDNDNNVQQVFGGYISSILPDSNRTKLTLHCADRLVDGQNKYVLDQMVLQGGTKSQSDDEYSDAMTKNFTSYPQALKYLCDLHEITLKSNISKDYTVDGEKYHKGVSITFGKNKKIKTVKATNGYSTPYKNYIMLRNNSSSATKQTWSLYDASKVAKKPPKITEYPYLHITYGLGSPKTELKSKTTETVDTSETTAGSQKFGKCGVSSDKKYVMSICKPSAGTSDAKKHNVSQNTLYKTIFENYCPRCKKKGVLRWDSGRKGTKCITCGGYHGSKREWGNISEGEVSCNSCCSDFDGVTGTEKDSGHSSRLKTSSKPVKSSKSEQDKLFNGKMVALAKTGVEVTPDSIFKAITKLAFKYKYKRGGGGQTYSQMKKTGYGDCWGFSDLIFQQLKKYGVSCKIVRYKTNSSDEHRSVLYKNDKKQWVDFPYRKYGWDTKYNNMLNNTSGSKTGGKVEEFKGVTIGNAKQSGSTSKSQTTTVTTTKGYDKDKPFQAYLKITYSLKQDFKATKYAVYVKFTQTATAKKSINTGLPLYWVNNTVKQTTLKLSNNRTLIDFLKSIHGESANIYLQALDFITPVVKQTSDNKDVDWYKVDNSTDDQSSCKLNLYQIVFDDNASTDPSELNSCGKSVNSMIKELVDDAGYYVQMDYGLHRRDDEIHFRVLNQSSESFTASEGDNNNILSWNSISYSPVSSLYNMSMQVFKGTDNMYYYVDTRDANSILIYGEQCTLQTSNEAITEKEAYFNAVMSDKFNPVQTYSYTITVPNYPNLRIGDLVKVIANAKKLNSVKEVKSIKISFDDNKMPRIQTEIGLDELAPDIQLKANIRGLRQEAKKENTYFYKSATPVTDEIYYEWDR